MPEPCEQDYCDNGEYGCAAFIETWCEDEYGELYPECCEEYPSGYILVKKCTFSGVEPEEPYCYCNFYLNFNGGSFTIYMCRE